MRLGAKAPWIDVRWTPSQQTPVDPFGICTNDFGVHAQRNHQRKTAGPKNGVQVKPQLSDVFRFLVIPGWNSDKRLLHYIHRLRPSFGLRAAALALRVGLAFAPLIV